jgi:hypothetical protein
LDGHIIVSFLRHGVGFVILICLFKVSGPFFETQNPYPLDLRAAACIVFLNTCIYATPTADTPGKVQAIGKKDIRIGWFGSQYKLSTVLFFVLFQ